MAGTKPWSMMKRREKLDWLRRKGEGDAREAKSIDEYGYLSFPERHTESYRAAYEIGYRAAKEDMRKEAAAANAAARRAALENKTD
jgi:flagellar biosynthesis/type III secretory pathway protein FliH